MQFRLTGLTTAALGAGALLPNTAAAQTMDLSIELPRIRVAEYHKPYVAVWLEREGQPARTLSVWYDVDKRGGEGTKWLHDVRQWWRASGRTMSFPADGISGATRAPGVQKQRLVAGKGGMPALTPGQYTLVVEAAREVGGREMLTIPFEWPAKAQKLSAQGKTELGKVGLAVKP